MSKLNIVIPLAGKSIFFNDSEYIYPKPLIEINNKTMIQLVIENLSLIKSDKRFIFILNRQDCTKYHLDDVLSLLTDKKCDIIVLEKETKGAACSVLMAIDKINNGEPLIIANADQLFDIDLNKVLDTFDKNSVDAGVICFEAVHPRWSFVRLNEKNKIIETAEKRPISKNAIAGFYYFKQGKDFVAAAMGSIRKDANVDGLYYISPTFNELVLSSKNLEIFSIPKEKYHTFYTPQKIKEYEELCK
jgi:NDP-sugar pyrophosphorylase family protein